ncbi:Rrf2 family transcriptional regulator [Cyanobium sp. NIES-981]|uniref:RrF2 family transcriptional regulator n=1 Tax=Cyanobium sp. NIES-981 TaxID=1851505 RepID=UPI0007DD35B9|nr:Rrf2 family transcriptional regulator [Cyanobium sp. NIES-981]SBO43241.1 conserved protein of unknown function [Cyanobium sp. NIES-981]
MAFSAKMEYGLVALIELAAAHASRELVQAGELCRRHDLPERYVEQVLTRLRKGGYLTSIRGPRGGFQLTRSPERITIAELEQCLDGESTPERQGNRSNPAFQVLDRLAGRAEQARTALLASTTLAQLLLERDSLRQPAPMFYI